MLVLLVSLLFAVLFFLLWNVARQLKKNPWLLLVFFSMSLVWVKTSLLFINSVLLLVTEFHVEMTPKHILFSVRWQTLQESYSLVMVVSSLFHGMVMRQDIMEQQCHNCMSAGGRTQLISCPNLDMVICSVVVIGTVSVQTWQVPSWKEARQNPSPEPIVHLWPSTKKAPLSID